MNEGRAPAPGTSEVTPGGEVHGAGAVDAKGLETLSEASLETLSFDAALAQLQDVVAQLEAGTLPLEEAIAAFERGVRLHRRCAALLDQAELRVQRLVEEAGGALRAVDLDTDEPGTR
jgi:exodeoxyribonuclease VII small subunit